MRPSRGEALALIFCFSAGTQALLMFQLQNLAHGVHLEGHLTLCGFENEVNAEREQGMGRRS